MAVKQNKNCYYVNFSTCTCNFSENCDKTCVGKELCGQFISENEYFEKMMSGTLPVNEVKEDKKEKQARINSALSLGKTKKQLKYEARKEAEKRGDGSGYNLFGDEKFKNLFDQIERK